MAQRRPTVPQLPQRFQPYMQQATAEGQVRYGGQRDALLELLSNAKATYTQSIAQARSAAAIIQAATQQAQNTLADPSNPVTGLALKAQGMPGSEGAIVAQNLGLTANAERSLLAQHQVQAADAQKYQGQQALRQYTGDAQKIGQQQLSLQDQYGSYITGRYDSLVQADRKQRHDANQAARTLAASFARSGVTPQGKVIKGGPADPTLSPSAQKNAYELQYERTHGHKVPSGASTSKGGVSFLPTAAHNKARDQIDYALSQAKTLKQEGLKRPQIYTTLVQGKPSFSTTANGTRTTIPGIKATPALLTHAAIELAYDGFLSAGTVRSLNRAGYRVNELGYQKAPKPGVAHPFATNDPNRLNR